ncbi:hypothetical protein PYCH_06580 [Pyrococcus yayanosii CH1]|uniref:Uncharacterized protein n=1 Tax=Pyrococcus yayanosii (strain CH1 / JCM 16557) TaxID=529709 RepID=F8AII0_PYRYC|nr:hypothetical protein PYCH_06580 [Pyrococcus yayanosii CH1]
MIQKNSERSSFQFSLSLIGTPAGADFPPARAPLSILFESYWNIGVMT